MYLHKFTKRRTKIKFEPHLANRFSDISFFNHPPIFSDLSPEFVEIRTESSTYQLYYARNSFLE